MASHDTREVFIARWLDARGLLARYPALSPEEILAACDLVPVQDMGNEWIMFCGGSPTPGKDR